jgi:hypothetical protein
MKNFKAIFLFMFALVAIVNFSPGIATDSFPTDQDQVFPHIHEGTSVDIAIAVISKNASNLSIVNHPNQHEGLEDAYNTQPIKPAFIDLRQKYLDKHYDPGSCGSLFFL